MGILPMFFFFFFFSDRNGNRNGNSKDMGKMPMLHTPVRACYVLWSVATRVLAFHMRGE
jgi:hypothetical protein